jgi:hypothetical protein
MFSHTKSRTPRDHGMWHYSRRWGLNKAIACNETVRRRSHFPGTVLARALTPTSRLPSGPIQMIDFVKNVDEIVASSIVNRIQKIAETLNFVLRIEVPELPIDTEWKS